jgi:hypothetical protein
MKFKIQGMGKAGDRVVDKIVLRDKINRFFWVEKVN